MTRTLLAATLAIALFAAAATSAQTYPSPLLSERMAVMGRVPTGGTPEQFAEHVRKEIAKWAQVIKSAGIKPQ